MRVATVGVLALLTGAGSGVAAEHAHFTPDEAVHRCLAEAGRAVEREFTGSATPVETFETTETDGGWEVDGAYRVDQDGDERTVRVTCRVTAEGTAVTTELPGD